MLNRIEDYMHISAFMAVVFIMGLGSMVELNVVGLVVLLLGLGCSIGAFLFFRRAREVYLESRTLDKMHLISDDEEEVA